MPAKDIYHDAVKNALIKDGWTITADPLKLDWEEIDLFVDLGAEKVISAEKEGRKIAVEIKSFISASKVAALENAIGQYILYYEVLARTEPERTLFLAVTEEIWKKVFAVSVGKLLVESRNLRVIVFDDKREVIVQWIG